MRQTVGELLNKNKQLIAAKPNNGEKELDNVMIL